MKCLVCDLEIKYASEMIKCTACGKHCHQSCLNMTSAYYMANHFTLEKNWLCEMCNNVTRRPKNDNTPIRKPVAPNPNLNDTTMSVDDSVHDRTDTSPEPQNTLQTPPNLYPRQESPITLENISKLLDFKLRENNQSILSDLKNTIQLEINKSIADLKTDITLRTNLITTEQTSIKSSIANIESKIKTLERKNTTLQQELNQLGQQINQKSQDTYEHNSKIIVLHGLSEYRDEHEVDIENRIIYLCHDVLGIDLTGYIEDISRIGRNSRTTRPLKIELISKRMAKYILKNSWHFKNTGISISEYLTGKALEHRKLLISNLRLARQNGQHAVIRDDKLVVNGRITDTDLEPQYPLEQQTQNVHANYPSTAHSTHEDFNSACSQNNTISNTPDLDTSNGQSNHSFRNNTGA
ncbi:uncharacterized protein LOC134658011 [Cydia amplana]|uniref:uncharacterized protein LOC134658011 n=1 Tax=Cydia amplana TaxID=1869771 RepID=UPI002FE5C4CF